MRTSTRTIERIILNDADLVKMSLIKYIKLSEDVVILRKDKSYYITQRLVNNEYAILGFYEKGKSHSQEVEGKRDNIRDNNTEKTLAPPDTQADGFLEKLRESGGL